MSAKVVAGKPDDSLLFQRIRDEEMPPDGRPAPSKAERELVAEWIRTGAAPFEQPVAVRAPIGHVGVVRAIGDDLASAPVRARRFYRYFSLAHLLDAGLSEDELTAYRGGLSKLLNSLSWSRTIVQPVPVDRARSVLRIDLRDFRWTATLWDGLARVFPYSVVGESPQADAIVEFSGAPLPYVRGDWFVALASRPPLYHLLLQIPRSATELERLVGVDVERNLSEDRVTRAAFQNSGISQSNRLIERHESMFGGYWRSYDFAPSNDHGNLFDTPLGPTGARAFRADGGEVIFSLPNGLHGYMLVDGHGSKIDRAPLAIVSDPGSLDRTVENGISCMRCHSEGIIDKRDQIRAHVVKNATGFGEAEREQVLALYAPSDEMDKVMLRDRKAFTDALVQTGAPKGKGDTVSRLAHRFEEDLDFARAAAEAGLTGDGLTQALDATPELARVLGPLQVPGGTVKREVFEKRFRELVAASGAGTFTAVESGRWTTAHFSGVVRASAALGQSYRRIPGGTYTPGCATSDPGCDDDEKDLPPTWIDGFWMASTETTVEAYARCVAAGACLPPARGAQCNDATKGQHPVNCVGAEQARTFCAWEGGRLPTAVEWEYAARSGRSTTYPWGDEPPGTGRTYWAQGMARANYCDLQCANQLGGKLEEFLKNKLIDTEVDDGAATTAEVARYSENPWGLRDVAGNVAEWTSTRAEDGVRVETRGGSWIESPRFIRPSYRAYEQASYAAPTVGFRCVRDLQILK